MAIEIERKFLVHGEAWRRDARAFAIRQGYLGSADGCSVRVRTFGTRAFITVKGRSQGGVRAEFEYEIPVVDADAMLDELCARPLIEKTRYEVSVEGRPWVVDVFAGDNAGLVLAEVELNAVGEAVALPPWAGEEVTADPRYLNVNLARHPFRFW
jgi:CYTH domain-containing protein